jgi:hypothetical protein
LAASYICSANDNAQNRDKDADEASAAYKYAYRLGLLHLILVDLVHCVIRALTSVSHPTIKLRSCDSSSSYPNGTQTDFHIFWLIIHQDGVPAMAPGQICTSFWTIFGE